MPAAGYISWFSTVGLHYRFPRLPVRRAAWLTAVLSLIFCLPSPIVLAGVSVVSDALVSTSAFTGFLVFLGSVLGAFLARSSTKLTLAIWALSPRRAVVRTTRK